MIRIDNQFELPLQWEFNFEITEHNDAETVFDVSDWETMPLVAAPTPDNAEIRRGLGGLRWEYTGQGWKRKHGKPVANWIHARLVG